jgi:ABC-type Fe3+ transport system permease subunit
MLAHEPRQSSAVADLVLVRPHSHISKNNMATNPTKQQYIRRIRAESAYPAFRSLIEVFVILIFVAGGILIAVGLLAGFSMIVHEDEQGIFVILGGCFGGVICIIIGKVLKEAAFMLADVADSITDLNSRYEQS